MVERSTADRVGGLVAAGFGLLALREAIRLFPMRTSDFAGDHITFALVGGVLVVLGSLLASVIKTPRFTVQFPTGAARTSMLLTAGLLLAYLYLVPLVGYLISTFPAAVMLFKALGSYTWRKALLYAAVLTTALYALFVLWLQMPLPGGIL